jgi:hypothetical protein
MKKQWSQPKLEILDVNLTALGSGGNKRDGYLYDEENGKIVEEFFKNS